MTSKVMPEAGKKAPAFTLPDETGSKARLSSFKGRRVVLYFYPKDHTPGCTTEAREFRAAQAAFRERNTIVLGISPDSPATHCGFIEKQDLNFSLLADEDHAVAEKYGVWVEKNMYGKKRMGIQRATFLIDETGKIIQVWPKVRPAGHAAEVLAAIDEQG
jgi:thioredoxin-dependent peroxiredoxin